MFDFGCYFPYRNAEVLTFKMISKRYGRKISKLGYPYLMKLDEQSPMILNIRICIKEKYMNLLFPICTNMTKEKPICGLSFRYIFDEGEFCFESLEKVNHGKWCPNLWENRESENSACKDNEIVLNPTHRIGDSNNAIFDDLSFHIQRHWKIL